MLPLAAVGLGLSSSIGGIYEVAKGFENRRYWDTYYSNHHVRPKYPYRSGYYSYNSYANALGRFSFAGSLYNAPLKSFPHSYNWFMYR